MDYNTLQKLCFILSTVPTSCAEQQQELLSTLPRLSLGAELPKQTQSHNYKNDLMSSECVLQ